MARIDTTAPPLSDVAGSGGPFRWLDSQRNRLVVLMALAAMAMLLPLISNNYVLEVMTNAWFYVMLCLGLNIVVGYAGLLDLGYAAFFAVGAYTTGILTSQFGVNFWLTIPAAVFFSICAGVIIGGPTLRLRSDYLAIVTLGFGEIVRIVARNLEITGGGERTDRHRETVNFRFRVEPDIPFLLCLPVSGHPRLFRQLPVAELAARPGLAICPGRRGCGGGDGHRPGGD